MPKIDTSQFEDKMEKELETTGLPSDLATGENAKKITDLLSQFAANTIEDSLEDRVKNMLTANDDTETQLSQALDQFGSNPQGSSIQNPAGVEGRPNPPSNLDNVAPPSTATEDERVSEENQPEQTPGTPEGETTESADQSQGTNTPEQTDPQPPSPSDPQTPSDQENQDTLEAANSAQPKEDTLGFTHPADHPATTESESPQKKEGVENTTTPEEQEQQRAKQLALEQQAARAQKQQAEGVKNQQISTLVSEKGELLRKAGAIGLKGAPILRIILGTTDTLDVIEFEDGALLSALVVGPLIGVTQVYFYMQQNYDTKKYLAKNYIKKWIGIAALELFPIIDILPWDSINSWMLARSVKNAKKAYNKEAEEIAKKIKKLESNQNH